MRSFSARENMRAPQQRLVRDMTRNCSQLQGCEVNFTPINWGSSIEAGITLKTVLVHNLCTSVVHRVKRIPDFILTIVWELLRMGVTWKPRKIWKW